jgi:S-adenosylmethionine-diacylgycerolhomoserine-N-methlytransferase
VATPEWIESFYRFQARFYDQTRWAFLFGRQSTIGNIKCHCRPSSALEIGCGTGVNIRRLQRIFPDAKLTGVDLSTSMLRVARSKTDTRGGKVQFLEMVYDQPVSKDRPFDLILFSYSLTMMNPGWDLALSAAAEDLASDGCIAVVDFHDCPGKGMKWYMDQCHVRIDGHLLPELETRFWSVEQRIQKAYAGWWRYFTFIGKKPDADDYGRPIIN